MLIKKDITDPDPLDGLPSVTIPKVRVIEHAEQLPDVAPGQLSRSLRDNLRPRLGK
jgi:hypothetical protein